MEEYVHLIENQLKAFAFTFLLGFATLDAQIGGQNVDLSVQMFIPNFQGLMRYLTVGVVSHAES